ncbi:MAG: metallophosphoesterase [Aureliella sp.]
MKEILMNATYEPRDVNRLPDNCQASHSVQKWWATWLLLLVLVCQANSSTAHPPEKGDSSKHSHANEQAGEDEGQTHDQRATTATTTLGEGLLLPDLHGPKPWSDKPALTDPQRFSIAIMTDRTGGHRPGIWMQAVERVNWLRPDFVVSVGDLIEGYTEDETEIAAQWSEFLEFIDKMEMKFFFVPGNHDVTNPKLHEIWRKQFGREWYSFDYRGVHFVCLNSEDPTTHVGDEQLAWLANDLAANSAARWTLVFLHKPLWVTAERDLRAGNPDSSNWSQVAELLEDRPHTVFAGHVHHYIQYARNGRDYYSLATTGGSSTLRGVPYGEFDHITWLTMEQDGPRVANLLLDGVQPANVVTESSIARFRNFLQAVRLEIEPILISDDAIQTGEIRIRLSNDFDQPVTFRGTIAGLPLVGLSMESQSLELTAQPGEAITQTMRFEMKQPVQLDRFRATVMTAKVASQGTEPLRAEWTLPVVIDKQYPLRQQMVDIEGDLQEWAEPWWSTTDKPELSGANQNWTGTSDCSLELSACYATDTLNFAVRVTDERVLAGDKVTLVVDQRPSLDRLTSTQLGAKTLVIAIDAPLSTEVSSCTVTGMNGRPLAQATALGRKTSEGYELEISAPLLSIVDAQGAEWSSVQLGARVSDVDAPREDPVEVLWRASPDVRDGRSLAHLIRQR